MLSKYKMSSLKDKIEGEEVSPPEKAEKPKGAAKVGKRLTKKKK